MTSDVVAMSQVEAVRQIDKYFKVFKSLVVRLTVSVKPFGLPLTPPPRENEVVAGLKKVISAKFLVATSTSSLQESTKIPVLALKSKLVRTGDVTSGLKNEA